MTEATEENPPPPLLTPQDCLVATMLAMCVSDGSISTSELVKIQTAVNNLPVFGDYDEGRIPKVSKTVYDLLDEDNGIATLLGLVRAGLPRRLHETAYALACDVAAADGQLRQRELRLLEELQFELTIDRLHAAAIERGARARHLTL